MRTSLNNIELAEGFLLKRLAPAEALLFETRMIVDDELNRDVAFQQQTYTLVKQYSRKKLKAELESVHQKLFTDKQHTSFADRIRRLFR